MPKEEIKDLTKFLKPFPTRVAELVFWLREFVWDLYPKSNELIYDNYNAVAFGWSPTDKLGDTFCSIAVGRTTKNIHFAFYWGSKISDPKKMLLGNGNQYRYILVHDKESFPKEYMMKLMKEAFAYSEGKMKKVIGSPQGKTITKSISDKKRSSQGLKKAGKKAAGKKIAKKNSAKKRK